MFNRLISAMNHFRLKSIDRLFLFICFILLVVSTIFLKTLKTKIEDSINILIAKQIESNAIVVAESVGKYVEYGEYRNAWTTLQRITNKNFLKCHAILSQDGNFLIDDKECKSAITQVYRGNKWGEEELNRVLLSTSTDEAIIKIPFSQSIASESMLYITLLYNISTYRAISEYIDKYFYLFGITILFFLLGVFIFLRKSFLKSLQTINISVQKAIENPDQKNSEKIVEEYFPVSNLVSDLNTKYKDAISKIEEQAKVTAFIELASQVSHDIRSPLSALNIVSGHLQELPEDKRLLLRNAVTRINDIANILLQKSKESSSGSSGNNVHKLSPELLPSLIDAIVSEKRLQYLDKTNIEISTDLNQSYGAFSDVNQIEFQRVLSNLINNSVEAFYDFTGVIIVSVKTIGNSNQIEIKDNGCGIPDFIINRLGEKGLTHGKEGIHAGSGLGLYHAKNIIESFGGTLHISPRLDSRGTIVTIKLPKISAPKWFLEKIILRPYQKIVVFDDDISVHGIWIERFRNPEVIDKGITLHCFTAEVEFLKWVSKHSDKNTLFLMDYELIGNNQTGLDFVERLNIPNSVLVTSRYEDARIRHRCSELGIPIIPKSMAVFVPFVIEMQGTQYHLILIDDDQLVRRTWHFFAKEKSQEILTFANPEEFYFQMDKIDPSTPVYIDSNLGSETTGQEVAVYLSKLGFREIRIATGYDPHSIEKPHCVIEVVGKDYPG